MSAKPAGIGALVETRGVLPAHPAGLDATP